MMEIQALASDRNKQKHGEVKTGQYDSFVPPMFMLAFIFIMVFLRLFLSGSESTQFAVFLISLFPWRSN
jgi:hypothetical protein